MTQVGDNIDTTKVIETWEDENGDDSFRGSFDFEDMVDAGPNIQSPSADYFNYKMNFRHRGHFIIINNETFDQRTGMSNRSGSDKDSRTLQMRFLALEFKVSVYRNKKAREIRSILKSVSEDREYNKNSDCFGCAILSHGELGIVYGTDDKIELDDLMDYFRGDICPELAGKPKIFIIQACRGSKFDDGAEVTDAEAENPGSDDIYAPPKQTFQIPAAADFIYAYSTVPGYFSWRNSENGSWFIQALAAVLEKYGHTRDLMWILTRVNLKVAYDFKSNAKSYYMRNKKQVPSIVSMLTKEVYFRPKLS